MANNVHAQATSTAVLDAPVIAPGHDFETVTEAVAQIPLAKRTPLGWVFGFLIGFALLMGLQMALGKLVLTGIGIWGNNVPVGWAFDIINFVWWIGIGHAGTLISAILLLFRQQWRMSINRFAEAMTIFAVACAAIFPLLPHRPPVAGGLLAVPVPEHDGPLAAVPQPADLGRVRGLDLRHRLDRVLVRRPGARPGDDARPRRVERASGRSSAALSLGWRGSARHWHRYEVAYADPRRPLDAAGALGPHRGQLRLRGVGAARLARDDLPALLRGRRHLRRLRHGADAGHPAPRSPTSSRTSSPCGTST